jgi:hypothetical protein
MMLVDPSVRVDHVKAMEALLVAALIAKAGLTYPSVIGDWALGSLKHRSADCVTRAILRPSRSQWMPTSPL